MTGKSGPNSRTLIALISLAVAHAAVLASVVVMAAANGPAFQVEIFRGYADKIAAGEIPYADFPYEYPPLSLFILILPRLLTADPALYAAFFGLQMLVFDMIILISLSRIGTKPLVLYGVGLLLFWRAPYIRHDLVPVAAATLGALLLTRGRALWAAALWGIGGALKLYPMVAVPALATGAGVWGAAKRWFVAGAVFVAGIMWGVAVFGQEALVFVTYHSDRPAMIESLPANIQLLLPGVEVTHSYGSFNTVGPYGEALTAFFETFQLAAVLFALAVVFWQGRSENPRVVAVRAAAAATFAFAVFGKVFAWHYLFWPLPLLAMASAPGGLRSPRATWALYFTAILLTTAINEQYWSIEQNLAYFTAMLTVRNLLLPLLFALILLPPHQNKQQRKHPAADDQDVR